MMKSAAKKILKKIFFEMPEQRRPSLASRLNRPYYQGTMEDRAETAHLIHQKGLVEATDIRLPVHDTLIIPADSYADVATTLVIPVAEDTIRLPKDALGSVLGMLDGLRYAVPRLSVRQFAGA